MDRSAVIARLDELGATARARMPDRAAHGEMVFAEIAWMTDAEVAERHALVAQLPSAGQERAKARMRLWLKHKLRRGHP